MSPFHLIIEQRTKATSHYQVSVCCYMPVCTVNMFFSRANRVRDCQHHATFFYSPHLQHSGQLKKIFFMNFSHKLCSSGWRASLVQLLHAFLTRRHTPDKIPQVLSAGVRVAHLMSYCSLNSHNPSHTAWLRSQWWIMRGTATEAKTMGIESNTEGGRMLLLRVYNINR